MPIFLNLQRFPNWLGDGNIGKGPHAVEFDGNNKLVWSWEDHAKARTITNLLVVE